MLVVKRSSFIFVSTTNVWVIGPDHHQSEQTVWWSKFVSRFDLRLAATLIIRCSSTTWRIHVSNSINESIKKLRISMCPKSTIENVSKRFSKAEFCSCTSMSRSMAGSWVIIHNNWIYCNSPHILFDFFCHLTEKNRMIINCSSLPIEWFWWTEKRIFNKKKPIVVFFINDRDSFEWIFLLKFFFTSEHTIHKVENCWQIDLKRVCVMTSEIN